MAPISAHPISKTTELAAKASALVEHVTQHYSVSDFPVIFDQFERWAAERPLEGARVLDASPPMHNTLVKYLPLLAGGAELQVAVSAEIPHDPQAIAMFPEFGIRAVELPTAQHFDVVMDCAGYCAQVPSRFGYAELTRSGIYRYQNCHKPVVMVDSSEIKQIENEFGTGDGFVRAMEQLGHGNFEGCSVMIFGGGKVGRGIARELLLRQAVVTIVDDPAVEPKFPGAHYEDRFDPVAVRQAIESAWCIVTATGIENALREHAQVLNDSSALIANMGVDDEFGPELPASRVLNAKAPLNFLLAEPTQLRYLDPTFALSNASALALLAGHLPAGINVPWPELEKPILALWHEKNPTANH